MFGSQYLRHNLGSKSNPGTKEEPGCAGLMRGLSVYILIGWFILSKYEYFPFPAAILLGPGDKSEAGAVVS